KTPFFQCRKSGSERPSSIFKYPGKHRGKHKMAELVTVARKGPVGVVTINNPPVNASSQAVRVQLLALLKELEQDGNVSAVLICCAGRTFMAGADITEFDLPELPAPHPNEIHAFLDSMSKPVVAA